MQVDRPVKKAAKKRAAPKKPALDDDDLALVESELGEPREPRDKGVKPRAVAKLPPSDYGSPGAALARFFSEPQPILRIELIRIFAPLAVLGFMSSRLSHADEWLSNAGFQVPEITGGDWRQPFYLSPLSTNGAWALAAVMVVSGILVSIGFRARIAALVFASTLIYVALSDRLAAFTVSKLSPAVMLALAACPIGTRFSVDAWLRKRKDPEAPLPELVAGGGPRFFQLLLPVFYFGSGLAKAKGEWLSHSHVLWTHLHDSYQTPLSWFLASSLPPLLWGVLQAVVLTLEVGSPLWFSLRKTRPYALLGAVGMHAMIGLMFWPVRWFSLLMITMWLGAFLPEAWLSRWTARSRTM